MLNNESVEVQIECKASRSGITFKRFELSRSKKLADLRELVTLVFELESFLAKFRFYHKGQEISCIRDIRQSQQERVFQQEAESDSIKEKQRHNHHLNTRANLPRHYIMIRRNLQPTSEEDSNQAQEAHEAQEGLSEASQPPSSESEGEDLLENPEADYQPIPELDVYQKEGIDDQYYEVDPEDRRAAERELRKQQAAEDGQGLDNYLEEDSQELEFQRNRRHVYEVIEEDEESVFDYIDAEQQRGPFETWITQQPTRNYIKNKFSRFVNSFRAKNELIYYQKLKAMCLNNEQTLVVDYTHFKGFCMKLAEWLAFYPTLVLPEYNAALYALACKLYPNYRNLVDECYFKVSGLPVSDRIRTLSYGHLDQLVRLRGVVTSVSLVYSQLRKVYYKCTRCGYLKGPFYPNDHIRIKLGSCHSCHTSFCYVTHTSKSVYRNYQVISIQEAPSLVAAGRIPRSKEAVLVGDNIDRVKPGDEVEVTGIFSTRYDSLLNIKQGFPVFFTFIEVNYIETTDKLVAYLPSTEFQFQEFPKQPNFALRFFNSIAPSIWGHRKVKKALTFALFGGVQKNNNKHMHRTRGDINVLLMGDPGIAKSQFLKSLQKIFGRCIYTTGRGASAVGLTAAVRQDSNSKEWKLQAGALVLADKGICLIDQFDKMSQQDRTSIHEAMEQQTISISKAGIVATLNARCSVIAAANPLGGIYNQQISFKDNIDLSQPILSRFDLVTVTKDRPDPDNDSRLASFLISQHVKSHPYRDLYFQEGHELQAKGKEGDVEDQQQEQKRRIKLLEPQTQDTATLDKPPEFLREYIKYARINYRPKLSHKTSEMIKQFYNKLREYSKECAGLTIVARHLESMIRIAQAHAKMHLRKETNQQDAKVAVSTMLRSYIDTQRHSTAERIKKAFRHDFMVYD